MDNLNPQMWKEAVKPTVCHCHLLLGTSPRAFTPLSSPRSAINVLWLSNVEILTVFCRVGKVTIPTVCNVSCPCLVKFTLLTLYSSLVLLLVNFGSPFFLFFHFKPYTPFHSLFSGLRASFPGELAILLFRSLYRSLPFYKLPRYKPKFFFSSSVCRQSLPLCLKSSLGITTKL